MNNLKDINRQFKEFPGKKYYRIYIEDGSGHDLSENSKLLYSITGCYADDYIVPATMSKNIFNIISDESAFKGYSGISTVLLPFVDKNKNIDKHESMLELLCQEYGVSQIHFTDIFGQNLFGKHRRSFIQKYVEILSDIELWAISFSVNKTTFVNQLPEHNISDKELYFILFWNTIENIAEMLPERSVFHINFEQDNNLSVNLVDEYIGKIHDGLRQCESLKDRKSSVCKHPCFFSKKALFYSSLADLAAYSNNVLQQKLDQGIPISKIKKNHGELIETTKQVFKHYTSLHQSDKAAASLILDEI